MQTLQLYRKLWPRWVVVDIGIDIGGVVKGILDKPHTISLRRTAAPDQICSPEQLRQVDLVDVRGKTGVVDTLKVCYDILRGSIGVAPVAQAVVVVTMAFVVIVIMVVMIGRGDAGAKGEDIIAATPREGIGAEAANKIVVAGAAIENIVALFAEQRIIASFAEDAVVADTGVHGIVTTHGAAVTIVTINQIAAAAREDDIVAGHGR